MIQFYDIEPTKIYTRAQFKAIKKRRKRNKIARKSRQINRKNGKS